jgi:hypothetical protein
MLTRITYRKHVLQDLRPYSCLFSTCTARNVTYGSRQEWVAHEFQHRSITEWICLEECGQKFSSRQGFIEHLFGDHLQNSSRRLNIDEIVDCRQQKRPYEPPRVITCPFCTEMIKETKQVFQKHFGKHFDQIALKTLPPEVFGIDEDDSQVIEHKDDDSDSMDWSRGSESGVIEEKDDDSDLMDWSPTLAATETFPPYTAPPHPPRTFDPYSSPDPTSTPQEPQQAPSEGFSRRAEAFMPSRLRSAEDYHTLAPPTRVGRLNRPHRPFRCTFLFAGCTQTFATKNEWKRHVATQHIQHKIWRCDFPSCSDRKAATFNRKDLFGQHLRRMHVPDSAKNEHKSKGSHWLQFVNSEIPKIQERCCTINRPLPERSSCGFCHKEFHGEGSWEDRMEHVGLHYENAIANAENLEPSAWTPDRHLIEYALREDLVHRHSDGTYTLVNTLRREQVLGART